MRKIWIGLYVLGEGAEKACEQLMIPELDCDSCEKSALSENDSCGRDFEESVKEFQVLGAR